MAATSQNTSNDTTKAWKRKKEKGKKNGEEYSEINVLMKNCNECDYQ